MRFDVRGVSNPAPVLPYAMLGTLTLVHGTTLASPQIAGAPFGVNQVANVYWAAWKEWQLLATSSRQQMFFNSVDILAFDSGNITGCHLIGSCSRPFFRNMATGRPGWTAGQLMTIVLDGNMPTPFNPETRVMHEMGHIADFVSAPNQGRVVGVGYDRDGAGWGWTSAEWTTDGMAEGFATFLANAALYSQNAPEPRTCETNGNGAPQDLHCWAGPPQQSLETGPLFSCPGSYGRQALASMRFFRDIFDSTNEFNDTVAFISSTVSLKLPACRTLRATQQVACMTRGPR